MNLESRCRDVVVTWYLSCSLPPSRKPSLSVQRALSAMSRPESNASNGPAPLHGLEALDRDIFLSPEPEALDRDILLIPVLLPRSSSERRPASSEQYSFSVRCAWKTREATFVIRVPINQPASTYPCFVTGTGSASPPASFSAFSPPQPVPQPGEKLLSLRSYLRSSPPQARDKASACCLELALFSPAPEEAATRGASYMDGRQMEAAGRQQTRNSRRVHGKRSREAE